jgi:phenylacetate-CoA ligase
MTAARLDPRAVHDAATEIDGIVWPPLTESRTRALPALLDRMLAIERSDAEAIARGQRRQFARLLAHFAQRSAFHRERLETAGIDPRCDVPLEAIGTLPLLTRPALQQAAEALWCDPPASHQPHGETRTSGSTGEPVAVRRTLVNQLFWLAASMREHLWWQRDVTGTLAIIRANVVPDRIDQADWGPPASLFGKTGPGHALSFAYDVAAQSEILATVQPHYLLTYPSNLAGLVRHLEAGGPRWMPRLRELRTTGETLPDALRDEVRRVLGVGIVDTYSSQELGVIAIECPVSGLYHVMADDKIVEVLDDHGAPCAPGEIGRVVVTDLHNFATPLVRYAVGDWAEAGGACACGRALPTLARVLGRTRNLVRYPDGTRRWPRVGFHRFREIAPITRYQLVQTAIDAIEVRLVVERALEATQRERLATVIREALGHAFSLDFVVADDAVKPSPGGKFDEFVCAIDS